MDDYRHHVSGFFPHRQEADGALSQLLERGLPRERLHIADAATGQVGAAAETESNKVLKEVLVDGAVGSAVGIGVGVLAEIALVAANVTLFVASPLIAPLALLGWGATLGGFVGAAAGAGSNDSEEMKIGKKEGADGAFSTLVRDAISSGQVVLVAETRTAQETAMARKVIEASIGNFRDVQAA